jgi:hypothetical protein
MSKIAGICARACMVACRTNPPRLGSADAMRPLAGEFDDDAEIL